jgi:WD40 repeat protein
MLKLLHDIQLPTQKVLAVAFSPDNQKCAAGDRDGIIHIIDVESGTVERKLKQHVEFVYTLAFNPDNGHLLSAGKDKSIREWDIETGTFIKDHAGIFVSQGARTMGAQSFKPSTRSHKMTILSIAAVKGGRMATASQDKFVKLWKNGEPIRTFDWHTAPVTCVRFQPETDILFSASRDLTLRSWNESNGALIHKYSGHYAEIVAFEFINDTHFVSVDVAGYVMLWHVERESPLEIIYQSGGRIQTATYQNGILWLGHETGKLEAVQIDIENIRKIEKPEFSIEHHRCEVRSICVSENGYMVSSDNAGKVAIWSIDSHV